MENNTLTRSQVRRLQQEANLRNQEQGKTEMPQRGIGSPPAKVSRFTRGLANGKAQDELPANRRQAKVRVNVVPYPPSLPPPVSWEPTPGNRNSEQLELASGNLCVRQSTVVGRVNEGASTSGTYRPPVRPPVEVVDISSDSD